MSSSLVCEGLPLLSKVNFGVLGFSCKSFYKLLISTQFSGQSLLHSRPVLVPRNQHLYKVPDDSDVGSSRTTL